MIDKIQANIEKELKAYISRLETLYALKKISPLLFSRLKEFLLRKGKRIRPCLCVIGYLGYSRKPRPGLYATALSLELLHDFMLIHDDIIDKSDTRRGKPSMHVSLEKCLKGHKGLKFNSQDLAIVTGDILFALAMDVFLSIREEPRRKEKALKKLIEAATYTGSGEFIELLSGIKDINKLTKNDIYRIYDLKTARYTFSYPLAIGALLAGAPEKEIEKLVEYGLLLGRAFQIQDDILGMFAEEKDTGKSALTDLREAKKTLLIFNAYKRSRPGIKHKIRKILAKEMAGTVELKEMRRIITTTGALALAQNEISLCSLKSDKVLSTTRLKTFYKRLLGDFSKQIIKT